MAEYIVQDSTLKNISDAIQEVTSFMPKRPLGDLPETIRAISMVSDYNYKYYGKTGAHVAERQSGRLRFDNYQSSDTVYLYSQDDVKGIYATCSVYDDQGNIYSDWYINEYDLEEEFFDIHAWYTFDDGNGYGWTEERQYKTKGILVGNNYVLIIEFAASDIGANLATGHLSVEYSITQSSQVIDVNRVEYEHFLKFYLKPKQIVSLQHVSSGKTETITRVEGNDVYVSGVPEGGWYYINYKEPKIYKDAEICFPVSSTYNSYIYARIKVPCGDNTDPIQYHLKANNSEEWVWITINPIKSTADSQTVHVSMPSPDNPEEIISETLSFSIVDVEDIIQDLEWVQEESGGEYASLGFYIALYE